MRRLLTILALSLLATPAAAQDEIKRDPDGLKGISPYNEDLAAGRKAYESGDNPAAITHFDAAIGKADNKMYGYLLKAQAQLANGDLNAALSTAETARSKEGTEEQHAKVTFLLADLQERKADVPPSEVTKGQSTEKTGLGETLKSAWERVKDAWNAYSAYVSEHSRVPDYKASAEDRKKKIDERIKRDKDYGEVRARIIKNEEDARKK